MSKARRCITRTDAVTAGSTSAAVRPSPTTQASTFASTAASRSPRAIASFSAAAKAANAGVRSVSRLPPGGASSRERTRPGRRRATSTATPAPNEDPTRWHDVTPRWSSVPSTSPAGSREPTGGRSDSPKPRRSSRTASRTAGQPGPLRVPHPAVGDAGVEQHHRDGAPRAGPVVGDAGRVSGTWPRVSRAVEV